MNSEILSKFSFDFYEKIKTEPLYYSIYSMILKGTSPEIVIEELLKLNVNINKDFVDYKMNHLNPIIYYVPKDFIENGKKT